MDERTLAALRGSIEKWRRIVAGTGEDDGASNCPLCGLFRDGGDINFRSNTGCGGCPVKQRSRADYCSNTPYGDTVRATFGNGKRSRGADHAELDFLVSLLPPGVSA